MKRGDEKRLIYIYVVDLLNPKEKQQIGNIMINAEISMGTLFLQNKEATKGTLLCFKDPLKQEQTVFH